MTAIVLLPDGTEKKSTYIGDSIVVCQDGSSYYWNEYSSETNTLTVIDVNSMTVNSNIPKENIGIVSSVSFTLNEDTFSYNKTNSNIYGYGGSGKNCSFSMSCDSSIHYELSSFSIDDGGKDYISGDNVFIPELGDMTVTGVTSITYDTILNYSKNMSTGDLYNKIPSLYNGTTGSGTGSIFEVTTTDKTTYTVSSVTISSAGTGYNTGDIVTTPSCTISIDDVDYGPKSITKIDMTLPTTLYDSPNNSVGSSYDTSGGGTGATFNITYGKLYIPQSVTLSGGGTGYKVGDVLSVGDIATATVNSTTSSPNTIISYTTDLLDISPTEANVYTLAASGGSGVGAAFTVDISNNKTFSIVNTSIIQGGGGYVVGDILKVNNILQATVTAVSDGALGSISMTSIPYNFLTAQDSGFQYIVKTGSGNSFLLEPVFTNVTSPLNFINETEINSAGTGYKVGDILYLEGALTTGYVVVKTITASGGISSIISYFNGNPLRSSDTEYNLTGGSGSGGTLTITVETKSSVNSFSVTGFTIIEEGYEFNVNDTISVVYNGNTISTISVTSVLPSSIKTISVTPYEGYYKSDIQGTYTMLGGTGSGATIEVTSLEEDRLILNSIVMKNSGYGYSVGDKVTIGSYGSVTVTNVSSSTETITSVSISINSTSAQSTDMAQSNVKGIGGTGSGATFNISSNMVYNVTSSKLASGGTGYNVGDYIIVNGYYDSTTKITYSDGGYGNVEEITPSTQPVTEISVKNSSHVSSKEINPVSTTGGSGSGLTVDLVYESVETFNIEDINLIYGGNGYSIGDVIDFGSDIGSITVTSTDNTGGSVYELSYNIRTNASYSPVNLSGSYEALEGSGSGLVVRLNYSPVTLFKISSINLKNGGYGYKIGDVLSVNGVSVYVTGITNII